MSRTGSGFRLAALGGAVLLVVVAALVGFGVGRSSGSDQATPAPAVPITLKPQPIDVGFAQDMSDHHDQAVQMALLAIDKASSQPVRTLAVEIVSSQRRENGILEQFLRDRGLARADPQRTVMEWMHEPVAHEQMPGLATPAQIVALTGAEGPAFDQQFVDLMIRHHEGGVHMAQYAAEHAETQYIRDLASRIVVAQNNELTDLRQLTATG
jgi:uncharacterized protein (DUF305 family)